ncbi:MAG TPA: DUF6263 family protein [Vicinamibacterales bacterium]|nr:DUF6263 family protein [Vicinamibacterales bacterium]
MKPRFFAAPTALLFVATAWVSSASAQPVRLRYNWTQGDVLTYRTVVRTNTSIAGGPAGTNSFEQTMGQTLKVTVAAVAPDGTATLRQVIEAVSLEMNTPGGKVAYDSTKPPGADADPRVKSMQKAMGAMVGEAISVMMAANGAVRRIDGTARIVDKLMADLPRDPMAGSLAQNIKAMLSEDALRSSLEQNFSRMPDAPVKPGDTWTAEQSVGADSVGKIVGKSTFTLKGIEGTGDAAMARIGVTLALRQQNVPSAGASVVMKLGDGKGEGELLFHVAKGRVERNTMRTDIASSATMRGPDGGTATLQNSTRTQMTMDLVK